MTGSASPHDSDARLHANRAHGRIALTVGAQRGRTHTRRLREEGSFRVRFPNTAGGEAEAVILNTAGGIAGGDRFETAVTVEPGAHLTLTTAAAEKIYRSLGPPCELRLALDVAEGGTLRWLPQETILFDRANLDRTITIDLAGDARIVFAEALVLGRSAMGERLSGGRIMDRWRVRRNGRLIYADGLRLGGDLAATLASRASAAGATAMAALLLAPGGSDIVEAIRARDFAGEVGASAWNGIAMVRLLAADGAMLRRDLAAVLEAAGTTLPRLWSN